MIGLVDYAKLSEKLVEVFGKHLSYLELAQTALVNLNFVVPVDPGIYDVVLQPEDGKVWYLSYLELAPGANTSVEAYVQSRDSGPEVLALSAGAGSAPAARDFKLDFGASARCVKLRLRASNSGTSSENIGVVIMGVETPKTV
jgi:hypothetical protein